MTTNGKSPETDANIVSLTRLPVFDDQNRLWGYELFCVGSADLSPATGTDSVALVVANSAYLALQHILDRGKKIFLDFNERGILNDMPYAFPPDAAVVKVNEALCSNPDIAPVLDRLKSDGFMIAVTGFSGNRDHDAIYRLADIISINVEGQPPERLSSFAGDAKKYDAKLMAVRVANPDILTLCHQLGFSFFSGAFFKRPDEIKLREITSNEVSRFNLLRLIAMSDPDLDALSENIQSDASISLRLLAYLNSAAFGFPQKIKSIQQAISLLGWNRLKNWLRVILITDVSQHKDSADLMLLAAQRGKFLELVAADHDYWGFDPDSLHLLGLFSLLDVMLGVAMKDIVAHLPLDAKLKSALCGEPNNEYVQLLELCRVFEEARWQEADQMIQQLNLDGKKVKNAFQKSVDWAVELTHGHPDA
jgi:EAL and modified HD-GYP domain-containing signal transduction protein